MKVERTTPAVFTPITITLETQEEVNGLAALLRHTSICEVSGFSLSDFSRLDNFTTDTNKVFYKLCGLISH